MKKRLLFLCLHKFYQFFLLIQLFQQTMDVKKFLIDQQSELESEYWIRIPQENGERKLQIFQKWNKEENQKYAQFLASNLNEFQAPNARRSMRFFNKMADQLANGRNNQQCRSHHQKMMKKYKNITKIINAFKPKPKQQKDLQIIDESTQHNLEENKKIEACVNARLAKKIEIPQLKELNEDDFECNECSHIFGFDEYPLVFIR